MLDFLLNVGRPGSGHAPTSNVCIIAYDLTHAFPSACRALRPGMVCRAGRTGKCPSEGPTSSPAAQAPQQLLCFLLLLYASASAAAEQPLCDMSPFTEQAPEGVAPCKTCFFPTYPDIQSLDLTKYKPVDFTNQWIYFAGDSTLRQVYGEFYGIIHRTQVRAHCHLADILIFCLANRALCGHAMSASEQLCKGSAAANKMHACMLKMQEESQTVLRQCWITTVCCGKPAACEGRLGR